MGPSTYIGNDIDMLCQDTFEFYVSTLKDKGIMSIIGHWHNAFEFDTKTLKNTSNINVIEFWYMLKFYKYSLATTPLFLLSLTAKNNKHKTIRVSIKIQNVLPII